MADLRPWGRYGVERGVPHTIVAHPGANVRRRCYLIVTDAMLADRHGPRPYQWLDAVTGAQFDATPGEGMIVPTDQAALYRMDLDSFAEEAFTAAGWQPEPCPDRLCPLLKAHHHATIGVRWLDAWPWDHPKARPLDDVRRAEAGYRDAIVRDRPQEARR